jgi:UDP-glucose 4-epimerase
VKLVVVGGTGFIGSHVVAMARAAGHTVCVLSRRAGMVGAEYRDVEYRRLDLGRPEDRRALPAILHDAGAVLHLASSTVPGTGDRAPAADVQDNLIGLIAILEAMGAAGLGRLIYLSSGGAVYGPPETVPIREDHRLSPISSYGIVKVAAEQYIRLFARNRGISAVILRPSNPYGEGQAGTGVQGLVGTLLARALSGEPVAVWGDGTTLRDYLHVRDLADLILRATESRAEGTFNAGSGRGTSVNEMIDRVRRVTGRSLEVSYGPARSVDAPVSILDATAARATFGWEPRIDLDKGLRLTWDWSLLQHRAKAEPPGA